MKKLFYMLAIAAFSVMSVACSDDDDENTDVWEAYSDWRNANRNYFHSQEDSLDASGVRYYTKVSPKWAPDNYVLMHWFNDRGLTQGNLVPQLTSEVATVYYGRLYNDQPFDSSYNNVDSLFVTQVSAVIAGWQFALQSMHVGDSVEILIPDVLGYSSSVSGTIPPYSTLRFNMGLRDITHYEIRP